MKQLTARNAQQVYDWVENQPHHKARVTGAHLILESRTHRLRIPHDLPDVALRPGGEFDTRMYRWDGEIS